MTYANPQNNVSEICSDLIGHVITEGTNNGYYSRSWRWTIESGEISNFQILNVRENSSERYTIDAQMHLAAGPHAHKYEAQVTIYYINTYRGWEIDMVKSRSLKTVRTYYYDDCINSYIDDGGIQGTRVALENNCDSPLEVGGRTYDEYDGWVKFSVTVNPHDDVVVGHFISDYMIDYVERP
jgi:hypothetical protein